MIEFRGVTKRYGGTLALDAVDLTLADDGIYCLLGRNGAGKTTFMKLLAGHMATSDGQVLVDGVVVSPARMPDSVVFVQNDAVQFNMRTGDLIDTAAGLQADFDADFAHEMAHRFQLDTRKRYRHLSFGMKTMLTTILVMANNSEVVLLDEPTLGFDAIMRDQFNQLLLESFQAHPRIIIVSTHMIDEIAKVAQDLVLIDRGHILVSATIDEIDERAYTLSGATDQIQSLLGRLNLNVIATMQAGAVMAAHIYDHRIDPPAGVRIERMGLQDFFINLVGDENHE